MRKAWPMLVAVFALAATSVTASATPSSAADSVENSSHSISTQSLVKSGTEYCSKSEGGLVVSTYGHGFIAHFADGKRYVAGADLILPGWATTCTFTYRGVNGRVSVS